uniref:Palmitoyltransferase n=1 Tax=Ditylum brightwellii TaxID=49249 RepID=A0A6U3SID7_9STRA|mmetsp:Transcript_32838/g.48906  ORF Transcript_32838/g.48906 Transcript_32838/m.48906 type:complete len:325 (+) Transcript_32838:42-1016(+)
MGRKDCSVNGTLYGTSFGAEQWLVLNKVAIVCASLNVSTHILVFLSLAINFISYSPMAIIIFEFIYVPCLGFALVSLFMTSITDPGAVPMGAWPLERYMPIEIENQNENSQTRNTRHTIEQCEKCEGNYKPPLARHDKISGRCVVKVDHFCPWVCNVIGVFNRKFFILFAFYTFLSSTTALVLLVMRSIRCSYGAGAWIPIIAWNKFNFDHDIVGCKKPSSFSILATHAVVMCVFFSTFVTLLAQYLAVTKGSRRGTNDSELVKTELNEIFGGSSNRFEWHWLLPLTVEFPDEVMEELLGYQIDYFHRDQHWQQNYFAESFNTS